MIDRFDVPSGIHVFQASIETKKLLKGIYHISLALDTFGVAAYDVISNILTFEIVDLGSQYSIKNDAHIEWLTGRKAAWRFMTAGFNRRDFFS